MSKEKEISQKEFIFQFYKNNPNLDIKHDTIISTVTEEWKNMYGKPLADPDRAIRKLYEEGKLIKVKKGVYRYDPDRVATPQSDIFPTAIKKKIFEKDNYKCVICGQGREQGFDIHADHIRPRSMGGHRSF